MKTKLVAGACLFLAACRCSPIPPSGNADTSPEAGPGASTVTISTSKPTTVYIAFGSDSVIQNFPFCGDASLCSFSLGLNGSQELPINGYYLNATLSFDAPVGCGSTKAEINVNNPNWYDTLDVSLVDGYSNKIQITAVDPSDTTLLGPPNGSTGNETAYGVYPLACDLCAMRGDPPCGYFDASADGTGCHAGTQFNPNPPCQWQGSVKGGATAVTVSLVP